MGGLEEGKGWWRKWSVFRSVESSGGLFLGMFLSVFLGMFLGVFFGLFLGLLSRLEVWKVV